MNKQWTDTLRGEIEEFKETIRAFDQGEIDRKAYKGVSGGLDKRILDFSFGAASSLDAEVECIADKVFFIAKGSGLADDERASLQAQGVL